MRKHFVLFSGGLDSAVVLFNVLAQARASNVETHEVEAVGINYGQRHETELEHAQRITQRAGVAYSEIEIPSSLMAGALLASNDPIPSMSYGDLPKGMSPTYVPFRNGLMLSLLAAKAQKWVMAGEHETTRRKATLYIGSHAEDAENDAYPDCSPEFMSAMGHAIKIGTYGMVELSTPLIAMKKADVIKYGQAVGVPWAMTWSCYKGERVHCGECMTCRARHAGFIAAGVSDPTVYAA